MTADPLEPPRIVRRWMAVMYTHLGRFPQLAVIPKCLVPGEAVEALAQLHGYTPGTVRVGTQKLNPDHENTVEIIHILGWKDVPE